MELLVSIELGRLYDVYELLSGMDPHLPIDVADMGLHRAQGYDKRRFYVLRIPPLGQQQEDLLLTLREPVLLRHGLAPQTP